MAISKSHEVSSTMLELAAVCKGAARAAHDVGTRKADLQEVVRQLALAVADLATGLDAVEDVKIP